MEPNTAKSVFASVLRTERLTLVLFDLSNPLHFDHSLALINSAEAIRDMGDYGIKTHEDYRRLIDATKLPSNLLGDKIPDGPAFWNICLGGEDGPMIGGISLAHRGSLPPDMGWAVKPAYWGKGYASEAGKELLRYFQNELGIKEIMAYPKESNMGSVRVAQKIGFVEGGSVTTETGEIHPVYCLPGMKRFDASQKINFYGDTHKEQHEV